VDVDGGLDFLKCRLSPGAAVENKHTQRSRAYDSQGLYSYIDMSESSEDGSVSVRDGVFL
jgi:hypothetical protein